jgi:hypothetical protein
MVEMRRVLASVALSGLILFGCGGDGGNGDGSSAASPADIIAAVETTAATGSVALDMTLEFNDSSSVPDGTTIDMTGSSTFGDPRRAELSADFESLGVGRIEMLIDETRSTCEEVSSTNSCRSCQGSGSGCSWI